MTDSTYFAHSKALLTLLTYNLFYIQASYLISKLQKIKTTNEKGERSQLTER